MVINNDEGPRAASRIQRWSAHPSRPTQSSLRERGLWIRNRLGLHPRPWWLVTLWLVVFPRDCPLCQQDWWEGARRTQTGLALRAPWGNLLEEGCAGHKASRTPLLPKQLRPFPTCAPLCTFHETLLPHLSLLVLQPRLPSLPPQSLRLHAWVPHAAGGSLSRGLTSGIHFGEWST